MKLINQNDYPDKIYITKTSKPDYLAGLKTTVKSSGCGLCCASMMAEHFGYEMNIDEAIQLSYDTKSNTSAGTKYIPYSIGLCEKFNLTCIRTDSKEELFKCLDEGGFAVANVGGDHDEHLGVFSHGGHYIAIDSHDSNTISILDPGYEEYKYDEPHRKDKVKVEYPYVKADADLLFKDMENRDMCLFLYNRTKNMKDLFDTIDSYKDEFINIWKDIVEIESPTSYKEGVDRVGQYFKDYAKKEMWEYEEHINETAGNAIAITMNPNAEGKPIVISGHMDTVHPLGSMKTYIDGNRMYGPGCTDCKGGLIVCLLAMKALKDCGFTQRKIIFLLQADEENGSKNSNNIEWMTEKSKDSLCFLNTEMQGGDTATIIRKGIMHYVLEVKGKAAHASACLSGVSAIKETSHKIIELEKLQEEDGITINVGTITGGSVSNTVPEYCRCEIDVRFNNDEEALRADEYINKVCATPVLEGAEVKVTRTGKRVAMEENEVNKELLNKVNEIFKTHGLKELGIRKSAGGSDASNISHTGIPTLDSIGVKGGRIHSKDEYAELDSLCENTKYLALIITDLKD